MIFARRSTAAVLVWFALVIARGTPLTAASDVVHAAPVATSYPQFVDELTLAVGSESCEVLSNAEELCRRFEPGFLGQRRPTGMKVAGDRTGGTLVAVDSVVDAIQQLGEASQRLTLAERWTAFAIREERLYRSAARKQVKALNVAALQRAYAEYHLQCAARQLAAVQLRALVTGRARVVVKESFSYGSEASGSITRSATVPEAIAFARQLADVASSPVQFAAPPKFELRNVYSPERFVALAEKEPLLVRLGELVDADLRLLAGEHEARLKVDLAAANESTQALALSSLGWWNGSTGRRAIDAALESDSESLRRAAVFALARLRHDYASLARLTRSPRDEVRQATVSLIQQHMHEPEVALRALKPLLWDKVEAIRAAAFAAVEPLMDMAHWDGEQPWGYLRPLLASSSVEVRIATIDWLGDHGNRLDRPSREECCRVLAVCANKPEANLREASSRALSKLTPPAEK